MAIDKRSTPTWVKVVIVVVALSFVALPVIGALGSGGSIGGTTSTSSGDAYATIAQQYSGQVQAWDMALESEPTSYTVLVNQGNAYYDWAAQVQQNEGLASTGSDRPLWLLASTYYDRAIEVDGKDPSVGTDFAISLFYAGRTDEAISAIENVMKGNPDFAPGYFNAGIFYKQAAKNAEAIAAFEKYLELDPDGTSGQPSLAQSSITELQSSPASATPITP